MAKEIVISERDNIGAVFEDGKIVEFFMNEGEQLVGDIILGKVDSTITSIDAAFVNIGKNKNGFIHITDLAVKGPKKRTGIRNFLQLKQNLLVQIAKEATSSKGPRLTSMLTIPGKYLVLTPYERKIGISRRIEDPYERDRLIFIAKNMCQSGYGIVLRTEAEYQSEAALREDLDQLLKRWSEILSMSEKAIAPAVLYRDQDLLYKVLRDALTPDVQKIIVDSPEAKARAVELLQSWSNDSFRLVQQHKSNVSLALQYDLFNELEKALQTKVVLPSGGYLVIEKTEALTVIDVNSGGTRDTNSLSETILKTNKEAAVEIARQLRLRDIGGVIVVDFIDMFDQREQQIVWQILANSVKNDKSQPQLGYFSEFSLLEMTRHRQKKSLTELLTSKCPYCDGVGKIRNSVYRADLLNNDSVIRRVTTFDNNVPKFESLSQKPKEDFTANVEYFEKQVPPPQYEAYKKTMKANDFTYVNNDEPNNTDSIEIEYTVPVEKPVVVAVEAPKHHAKPHANSVHHRQPKEKVLPKEDIVSKVIDTIPNLDVLEPIVVSPEQESETQDSQQNRKPNVFVELSDEEKKYIQSIDHRGNGRRDRFNKDKRNFNDRRNPRNDNRYEKDSKFSDNVEKPIELEEKTSFVETIVERPILEVLPVVVETVVKEVPSTETVIQITEIINENNELIRKEIHVEPVISVEPTLPQIEVVIPADPVLSLTHDVEHVVESVVDDEIVAEVVEEKPEVVVVVPKKRGRKPKKPVEVVVEEVPVASVAETKKETPILNEVEKIQEKEEILKEKINDLIQTVLNPEVIDKVETVAADFKPEVKKKKPRRIRSFAPPKKKK